MARADRITETRTQITRYSDFDTNFSKNPVTGFLQVLTNAEDVKQSVRNLILTGCGERFFQPTLGSKVRMHLFEPDEPITRTRISDSIEEAMRHEPRASLISVDILDTPDSNSIQVSIVFGVINVPNPVTLVLKLRRIR